MSLSKEAYIAGVLLQPNFQKPELSIATADQEVTFASGVRSPFKMEFDHFDSAREAQQLITDFLELAIRNLKKSFDYICGIERGGLRFSIPLADKLGIPHISVSPEKLTDDEKILYETPLQKGTALLIDDVLTKGTSSDNAANRLKATQGIDVTHLLVVFSYGFLDRFPFLRRTNIPYTNLTNFETLQSQVNFDQQIKGGSEKVREWYAERLAYFESLAAGA